MGMISKLSRVDEFLKGITYVGVSGNRGRMLVSASALKDFTDDALFPTAIFSKREIVYYV